MPTPLQEVEGLVDEASDFNQLFHVEWHCKLTFNLQKLSVLASQVSTAVLQSISWLLLRILSLGHQVRNRAALCDVCL